MPRFSGRCQHCGNEFVTERKWHGELCDRCDRRETAEMTTAYSARSKDDMRWGDHRNVARWRREDAERGR